MSVQRKNSVELLSYRQEVEDSIALTKRKIGKEKKRRLIDFKRYQIVKLQQYLLNSIGEIVKLNGEERINFSSPPSHIKGDFSVEVFDLAKKAKKSPHLLAQEIAMKLNVPSREYVKSAAAAGPFVNIELNRDEVYRLVLEEIIELGNSYGETDLNQGKVVIIDYSSPNIAKPIGVGHLRSTIIGQALSNIYRETGFTVIRDNHLGDWGTQFGSLLYAFKKWGNEKDAEKNPINYLKELYVKFHKYSTEHPEVKDDARKIFSELEEGDPELIRLWKRFRDLSLKDFDQVYSKLGVDFDLTIGESYFTDSADNIVEECLKKGVCKKDAQSNAVVVEGLENIPSFLLRKSDGSSLYISRDLATIQFRIKTFSPDVILYVVGSEQDLNFKQLFGLARFAGYLSSETLAKHISFGMVLRDGKKMSTRKGTLIELEELMDQAVIKSSELLTQKNPDAPAKDVEEIAEIIGVGGIIYNDLRQSRIKNIMFDWSRMLNMEGGSAVYLQYTYVRIYSILKRISAKDLDDSLKVSGDYRFTFKEESEFQLAKKLMFFPEVVVKAQLSDSPHHICVYLEELAALFNSFYNDISLLKTKQKNLLESRMELIKGVAVVIKKGLSLLSIRVPERM